MVMIVPPVSQVDHHFAKASQGAIGLISTEAKAETKDLEHHNIPASAAPIDPDTVQAKVNFESKCPGVR